MDGISQMLSRCAMTMLGPTSIQAVLDHFVGEVVDVMDVDGAGAVVLPTAAAPGFLAASDATAMECERLQASLHQGPCVLAHDSAMAVSVPDLAWDTEFREFTPAARDLGLASVFAFPLRRGDVSLGALDLYRMSPGMLGEAEMSTVQMLADVLAAYLVSAQTRAVLEALAEREHSDVRHLRELSAERDDFVATLIHELGSPLTNVTGFSELLEEEPAGLSVRQRHYVSAIHRNSVRLGALTTDLLDLFSLEHETVHAQAPHTEVDLGAVVAAAREVLFSTPATLALDVVFVVPEQPILVHGRQDDLERMLSNLMSNAVKYTPAGGTVTCTLSHQAGHATLEVRDTGIGIPEEEQGELFTKFFRASSATARGIQGTGLGLAIVKSVVHGHAGAVDVFSTLDTGTRIVVRLPLAAHATQS
jgi:signal transduction histidine kinase